MAIYDTVKLLSDYYYDYYYDLVIYIYIFIYYRIPLHLFPVETQNKILEVVETKTPTTTTEAEEKYVDSSSFREAQSPPVVDVGHRSAVEITLR